MKSNEVPTLPEQKENKRRQKYNILPNFSFANFPKM